MIHNQWMIEINVQLHVVIRLPCLNNLITEIHLFSTLEANFLHLGMCLNYTYITFFMIWIDCLDFHSQTNIRWQNTGTSLCDRWWLIHEYTALETCCWDKMLAYFTWRVFNQGILELWWLNFPRNQKNNNTFLLVCLFEFIWHLAGMKFCSSNNDFLFWCMSQELSLQSLWSVALCIPTLTLC